MSLSKIKITDWVWNPIVGCTKVSDGCLNCYSESQHKRFVALYPGYEGRWRDVRLVEKVLREPAKWGLPRTVCACSTSDLFHESLSDSIVLEVFQSMQTYNKHVYVILTKRPERALEFLKRNKVSTKNIWLGISVEDRNNLEDRIGTFKHIPIENKWIAFEPLLDYIKIDNILDNAMQDIKIVMIGGESGRDARPMFPEWVEEIANWAKKRGKKFVFRGWGSWVSIENHDYQYKGIITDPKIMDKKYDKAIENGITIYNMGRLAGRKFRGESVEESEVKKMWFFA